MPPCALHLILAVHRYLWRFLYDVINKRGQDDLIPNALRHISLDFLAFQIESYFKRYIYAICIIAEFIVLKNGPLFAKIALQDFSILVKKKCIYIYKI